MSDRTDWPLEPDRAEMERILGLATEAVVRHLETLPDRPSHDLDGAEELAAEVKRDEPGEPADLAELLELVVDRLSAKSYNNLGPRFLAYIPGGGLFHAAVADLVADAMNRYVGVWSESPALTRLELDVIRWFCSWVGYPPEARGFLSTGGSIANFSAVVTARHEKLGEAIETGTVYVSDQTHHSALKATRLAGIRERNVRSIPVDEELRIRVDALEAAIAADRAAGLRPFLLIGNGGTTNTGAIDPLGVLADVAAREDLWFHVDAAYGGFFVLTERGRARLAGLERADSITLDPHKGLFLPYGTGCLLARDVNALARAHRVDADYMPPMQDDPERIDFASISPELSRDFRGLRIWLPLRMLGVEPFREALDEKLDLARWAAEELATIPGVVVVSPPHLSTLAFRLDRPELDGEALDNLNRRLLDLILRDRTTFLTATRVGDRFVIRISILNFRTHREHVADAVEAIRRAVLELADERSTPDAR